MIEIYKITCQICNKIYIGKHHINNRLPNNYLGSGKKQKLHLKEHKTENQIKQIILYCEDKDTKYYEEKLIELYDATNPEIGLNISKKSKGMHEFSEEIKKKMRKPKSEEHKQKLREAKLGKKHSEETIKKCKQVKGGKNHPMWGKHHSKESNERNRQAHLNKKISEDIIKKRYKPVIVFDKNGNFINKFNSIKEATNIMKINHITDVVNYKRKSAGGYYFRFVN